MMDLIVVYGLLAACVMAAGAAFDLGRRAGKRKHAAAMFEYNQREVIWKRLTELNTRIDESRADTDRNIDQVVRNINDDVMALARTLEKELEKVDTRIDKEVAEWRMQMAEAIVAHTLTGKRK